MGPLGFSSDLKLMQMPAKAPQQQFFWYKTKTEKVICINILSGSYVAMCDWRNINRRELWDSGCL